MTGKSNYNSWNYKSPTPSAIPHHKPPHTDPPRIWCYWNLPQCQLGHGLEAQIQPPQFMEYHYFATGILGYYGYAWKFTTKM